MPKLQNTYERNERICKKWIHIIFIDLKPEPSKDINSPQIDSPV